MTASPPPLQAVRVEVGAPAQPAGGETRYEMQESPVDALSESPYFTLITITFCCLRLVRPVLLLACFAGGPHEKDSLTSLAHAFLWLAAVCGILGAVIISPAFVEWTKQQGAPPKFTWNLQGIALSFLACAVGLDLFHQIFALGKVDYFWGTGVTKEIDGDEMLAFILVMLHGVGFLGLICMIAAFARCFRASWRTFSKGPPPGYADDHLKRPPWWPSSPVVPESDDADLEDGSRPGAKAAAAFVYEDVPTPARSAAAGAGPRSAAADAQSPPRSPPQPAPPPQRAASAPAQGAEAPPHRSSSSSAPGADGRSVGSPPRSWLWTNDEWVPVRIMRSSPMPDGAVYVRLQGGRTIQTRHALLRPRAGEDPPQGPPTATHRPSSAGRASSKPNASERSGSAQGPRDRRPSGRDAAAGRPSSAPPAARSASSASVDEADSEGALWAAGRMERLKKELKELDGKPPAERRTRLRQLQRELHPDKQPPELRPHSQPLFMFVQKEWELDEACAKAAAERAAS